MTGIRVFEAGSLARAALAAADGRLERLGDFDASPWWRAAGSDGHAGLVWLGARASVGHPRRVLVDSEPAAGTRRLQLDPSTAITPAEPAPRRGSTCSERLARHALALRQMLGNLLDWPDDAVSRTLRARAGAFGDACARDDWIAAGEAAERLLGAGPGFTPAGDDWLGGALVALVLSARGTRAVAIDALARRVLEHARQRTHEVSAALLADCIGLRGYAPLMALARAVADDDAAAARAAAGALSVIGHSSGRDLLRGFTAIASAFHQTSQESRELIT